jgi:hypothetical protein
MTTISHDQPRSAPMLVLDRIVRTRSQPCSQRVCGHGAGCSKTCRPGFTTALWALVALDGASRALCGERPVSDLVQRVERPSRRRARTGDRVAPGARRDRYRDARAMLAPIVLGVAGDPDLVDGQVASWVPIVAWRW